jgi:hypothetical protein
MPKDGREDYRISIRRMRRLEGESRKIVRPNMKKAFFRAMFLAMIVVFPVPTMAGGDVGISISLPPLIVFAAPPVLVVIPETYVYVVPDAREEIFFYNGWWWRPWEGRWYRSRHYDSGWAYYQRVPSFYARVPRGWRNDYRDHRWEGHPWNYQRIPHQQAEQNWGTWQKTNHWEKQQTWGVEGLKPRAQSKQPPQAAQQKSKANTQSKEGAKPQQSRPQSGEGQSQHSQPQHRDAAPQQSKPAQAKSGKEQGKPDKGHGNPDKGQEDKQGRR